MTRRILLKDKSYHTVPFLHTVKYHNLQRERGEKRKRRVLKMAYKVLMIWYHSQVIQLNLCDITFPCIHLLSHFIPAELALSLLLKQAVQVLTSGPLHWLCLCGSPSASFSICLNVTSSVRLVLVTPHFPRPPQPFLCFVFFTRLYHFLTDSATSFQSVLIIVCPPLDYKSHNGRDFCLHRSGPSTQAATQECLLNELLNHICQNTSCLLRFKSSTIIIKWNSQKHDAI